MNSRFTLLFFALLFPLVYIPGCSGVEKINFEKRDMVFLSAAGEVKIKAEIAKSDEERSRGLMYRKELKDGDGMLFVSGRDEVISFWMKNTLIPLSIAFISSDGRILEIKDMAPGDLSSVKSSRSVRYAMEVPQGWFERAGIKTGDALVIQNF